MKAQIPVTSTRAAIGFRVRFKGHLCAAVRTGYSRAPILVRARKDEEPWTVYVNALAAMERWAAEETNPLTPRQVEVEARRRARMACARAILRTERLRFKLRDSRFDWCRGAASVERLLRDSPDVRRPGSGKRWKIVAI